MNTFRNWLYSLADGVHAQGGLWAVSLYPIVGTFLLLVTTGCLLVISIALMLTVPALVCLRGLAWISAKLFTLNKTRSSNVEM
jgi:hypothetical protein